MPEHLRAEQQDARMLMVEVEALLTGLAGRRLGGGHVEQAQVREMLQNLREPVLRLGLSVKRRRSAGR